MADAREYELKFLVEESALAQVLAHPLLGPALGNARTSSMAASYFDTPGQRLRRHGISLRIREAEGRKTETLKQAGPSPVDRGEWEFETQDRAPDLASLLQTPLARHFEHRSVKRDLREAFTVTVDRATGRIVHGAAEVELALDRGTIEANGKSAPVGELELELKGGEPGGLFALARALVTDLPLTPSLISKAERGFRLLDEADGEAKDGSATLDPDMTAADGFQTLAYALLKAFALEAASITAAIDVEAVHRTRVALRRLRAALALFKPLVEDERFDAVQGELKWMSDLLGTARDRDVVQTELFDPAARDQGTAGVGELAEHMRAEQKQAHDALLDGLHSPRWRLALLALIEWLGEGTWRRTAADETRTLGQFATTRLKGRRKALLKAGDGLQHRTPHERHQVRIRAKKLRYSLGFFVDVAGLGKGSKPYRGLLKGLEGLQASLGRLHDHEAQQDLLRSEVEAWAEQPGAPGREAAFAAGRLVGTPPDHDQDLDEAKAAFRKVERSQPF